MTKFDEVLELMGDYKAAIDLVDRANNGWTNKTDLQVANEYAEAKEKLHNFLKENLKDD